MSKKETTNLQEVRNKNYEAKKMNTSENSKKKKDKDLPWWVELLFVQIGLPDKLLIKILKVKKTSKEFIQNEKKSIIMFLFVITTLAYFYPVIKHAKNKLDCEALAKNYIIKNKNIIEENIFENRFMHVPELKRLGAKINIKGNKAIIEGTNNLEGAELMSSDLRASVALVLAAFISRGTSIINRVYHLDRGYEKIENKLKKIGVKIKRIS